MKKVKEITKKIGTFFGTIFLFVFSIFGWAFSGKRKNKPKEEIEEESPSIDYEYEKEKCLRKVDLDSLPDDFSSLSPFDFYDMKTKRFLEPEKEPDDLVKYLEDLKKIDDEMPYDMEMLPLHDKLKEKITEIEDILSIKDSDNLLEEEFLENENPLLESKNKKWSPQPTNYKQTPESKKFKPRKVAEKETPSVDQSLKSHFKTIKPNQTTIPQVAVLTLPAISALTSTKKDKIDTDDMPQKYIISDQLSDKLPDLKNTVLPVKNIKTDVKKSIIAEQLKDVDDTQDEFVDAEVEDEVFEEEIIEELDEKEEKEEKKVKKKKKKEEQQEKTLEQIKEEDAILLTELLEQDVKEKEAIALLEKDKKQAILKLVNSTYQDFDFPITLFNYNIVINLFSMMKLNNSLVSAHRVLDNYKSYDRIGPSVILNKMRTIDVLEKKTLENLLSVHELRKELVKNYSEELASKDPDILMISQRLDQLETDLSFRYEKMNHKQKNKKKRRILVKE